MTVAKDGRVNHKPDEGSEGVKERGRQREREGERNVESIIYSNRTQAQLRFPLVVIVGQRYYNRVFFPLTS